MVIFIIYRGAASAFDDNDVKQDFPEAAALGNPVFSCYLR